MTATPSRVFAVLRSRGQAWDHVAAARRPARVDGARQIHDRAVRRGLRQACRVARGHPRRLGDRPRSSAAEIEARLSADPWVINGLLVTRQISPWQLRLGSLSLETTLSVDEGGKGCRS